MKVIVSVTTTKARLGLFFYAFQSLKRQTYNDFTIHISLSKEPYLFDEGIEMAPEWMTGANVEVHFVPNSGPYRKLIPLIGKIGGEDIIVTADDDVLYSENWLRRLVERALLHPNYIVCGSARIIKKNVFGRFQNYSNWEVCLRAGKGSYLLPLCGAGAVFRRDLLDLQFLSNEAYLKYAPTADDLWFRLASIRKNKNVYVDPQIDEGNGYIRHHMGLERINLHRPKMGRWLYERVINLIINKFDNYFGIPLSGNDFSWRKSLEYSNSSDYFATAKKP